MEIKEFTDLIKNLIADNKIKRAIRVLEKTLKTHESHNTILQLSAQFEAVKKSQILGLNSEEEVINRIDDLRNRLLEYLIYIENKVEKIDIDQSKVLAKEFNKTKSEEFNLTNIYKLLKSRNFKKKNIKDLIKSRPKFKKLKTQIKSISKKDSIVLLLLEFADKKNCIDEILMWAKGSNPLAYKKYEPFKVEELNEGDLELDLVYRLMVKYKNHLPKERSPRIMISGTWGNGKTTTINTLFGKEVGRIGHDDKGTFTDSKHKWNYQDEKLQLIDVPGLGDSRENDKKTKKLYKDWAKRVDGFIVVVSPPRPLDRGTIETVKILTSLGVPSKQIVFGINKLPFLSYTSEVGEYKTVQITEDGPYSISDKKAIDKLKLNFLRTLKLQFPNEDFKFEQVIEYDSRIGWNIYNLISAVIEILPFQAIKKFEEATRKSRDKAKKKLKEKERKLKLRIKRKLLEESERFINNSNDIDLKEKFKKDKTLVEDFNEFIDKGKELAKKTYNSLKEEISGWFR